LDDGSTFSNFETQGKLRQLLDRLMRYARRMPPAGCKAVSRGLCEVSAKISKLNDIARFGRWASIQRSFSYRATVDGRDIRDFLAIARINKTPSN
jgi:hypothetical protein